MEDKTMVDDDLTLGEYLPAGTGAGNRPLDWTFVLVQNTAWEELSANPWLTDAMHEMGYDLPSKLQRKVLCVALSNPTRSGIFEARCGAAGKSPLSAILLRIDEAVNEPQAIWVTDTYQQACEVEELCK
jgi:hypothetical protein